MATKIADRAFVSVNGAPVSDVQSSVLKQTRNAKESLSMTRDGFNRGFVQGNLTIDITIVITVRNKLARPKFEAIDYEASDVQITYMVGVEQFIATGIFLKDAENNAGGVGDEVKATFNFGALRLQDSVGNSSLFNIVL